MIVAVIMLCIGAVCRTYLSKPVGNMLFKNEIETSESNKLTERIRANLKCSK